MVEGAKDKPMVIDTLAGNNLQLLLMHNGIDIYNNRVHHLDQPLACDSNCGGEGVCDACVIKILEGEESLCKIGPKEKEIKTV